MGTSGPQRLRMSSFYQSAYSFFNIMLEHLFRFVAGCWLNNQLLCFFFPCPVEQSKVASPLTAGYLKEKTLTVSTWLAGVTLPFCPTMSHQAFFPECAGPLHLLPLYSKSKGREEIKRPQETLKPRESSVWQPVQLLNSHVKHGKRRGHTRL